MLYACMKRFSSVVLVLLFGWSCSAPEPKPPGLEGYIAKDLRKLGERTMKEFRKEVEAVTGDKPEKIERGSFEPWWVKPFVAGGAAWVFLEGYPGYEVPDVSGVRIHVFDNSWKRITKQSIPTGYRFFLNQVDVVTDNSLKQDLLVAKVTSSGPFMILERGPKRPAFEQGDFQRQYYALLGGQFVMVRLEDNEDRLVQNHYSWCAPPKGPAVPKRTREEWIRSLSAANPVEQLATLVWLSGQHLPSTKMRKENIDQESVDDAKLFEAVRDSADTIMALQELANSKNPWVKEYAKFTLQIIVSVRRTALEGAARWLWRKIIGQ